MYSTRNRVKWVHGWKNGPDDFFPPAIEFYANTEVIFFFYRFNPPDDDESLEFRCCISKRLRYGSDSVLIKNYQRLCSYFVCVFTRSSTLKLAEFNLKREFFAQLYLRPREKIFYTELDFCFNHFLIRLFYSI